jgi:hypothetical protein
MHRIDSSPAAAVELRPITWALYAAAAIVLADMYLTQPILPLLAQEFGVAPAVAGLSVSLVVLFISLSSTAYSSISHSAGWGWRLRARRLLCWRCCPIGFCAAGDSSLLELDELVAIPPCFFSISPV